MPEKERSASSTTAYGHRSDLSPGCGQHRCWRCLPRASLFRSRSRSSTLQFLMVVANGVFKHVLWLQSTPVLSGESCQHELRGATEVPTVRFTLGDEWLHAERVLRARVARRGYFFRQLKKRDAQLGAQPLSHGKACEVARGAPVASLLVPVAMLEQGLSSKLLAFEKQVAVLELGEKLNETEALEWERELVVVERQFRIRVCNILRIGLTRLQEAVVKVTLQASRSRWVRGLASPDRVLDALWWSGAGLVAPRPNVIEAIRTCTTSGVEVWRGVMAPTATNLASPSSFWSTLKTSDQWSRRWNSCAGCPAQEVRETCVQTQLRSLRHCFQSKSDTFCVTLVF